MAKYKVIFLGTTELSQTILNQLFHHPQVDLQLIITQPDRKVGRQQTFVHSPVKDWAIQHQIPLEQPENLKTLIPLIKKIQPDLLITAAYGQIVPKEILESVKIEALNVHGSLLPRYRGGAPVQMAIWNGDLESGVTIMRMVSKMDAGPIFGQKKLAINQTMTGGELMEKIAKVGGELLTELLEAIGSRKIKPHKQEFKEVTFAPNIKPEQEKINWTQTATQIHNQIRALAPKPGAFTIHNDYRIKIFKTSAHPELINAQPGKIIELNKHSFKVQTGKGILEIFEIQRAGKNKIDAGIFGSNNLKIGDVFD